MDRPLPSLCAPLMRVAWTARGMRGQGAPLASRGNCAHPGPSEGINHRPAVQARAQRNGGRLGPPPHRDARRTLERHRHHGRAPSPTTERPTEAFRPQDAMLQPNPQTEIGTTRLNVNMPPSVDGGCFAQEAKRLSQREPPPRPPLSPRPPQRHRVRRARLPTSDRGPPPGGGLQRLRAWPRRPTPVGPPIGLTDHVAWRTNHTCDRHLAKRRHKSLFGPSRRAATLGGAQRPLLDIGRDLSAAVGLHSARRRASGSEFPPPLQAKRSYGTNLGFDS